MHRRHVERYAGRPAGCRDAVIVLAIVFVLIALLVAAVWWGLRDMGLA